MNGSPSRHGHQTARAIAYPDLDDRFKLCEKTPVMIRCSSSVSLSGVVLCAIASCGGMGSSKAPTLPSPSSASSNPIPLNANIKGAKPDDVSAADREAMTALSREAEQVFGAFGNGMPRLSRDGKTLLFRSNRNGLPQVYVAQGNGPHAAPRRL